MKKKKIVLAVSIPLILIGIYFAYKLICLNIYKTTNTIPEITILAPYESKSKNLTDEESFKVHNISMKNVFADFTKEDNGVTPTEYVFVESYKLADRDKTKAGATFSKMPSLLTSLRSDESSFLGPDALINKETPKYMKTQNFRSDYEFIKFLSEYKEEKMNIFTPVAKMKENYVLKNVASTIIPPGTYREIKGKYQGYIFQKDTSTEINIEYGGSKYTLFFLEKEKTIFTDSVIEELIDSIEIDN